MPGRAAHNPSNKQQRTESAVSRTLTRENLYAHAGSKANVAAAGSGGGAAKSSVRWIYPGCDQPDRVAGHRCDLQLEMGRSGLQSETRDHSWLSCSPGTFQRADAHARVICIAHHPTPATTPKKDT